jgi:hypothetical protein
MVIIELLLADVVEGGGGIIDPGWFSEVRHYEREGFSDVYYIDSCDVNTAYFSKSCLIALILLPWVACGIGKMDITYKQSRDTHQLPLRDFRLPPPFKLNLRSSRILRSVEW